MITIGRGPDAEEKSIIWEETPFGDMLVYDIPDDCDVVLLCEANGTGMVPRRILLPHQVYRKTIEQYNGEVILIPANSKEYIYVETSD
jgi:hypothetical protein